MKRIILFITILLSTLQLFAQRENDIWYMGTGYGLKFDANNNTSYVPLMTMSQNGVVVCDSLGNLLFYSNGRIIKDRNHNIMPNSYFLNASDYSRYGGGNTFLNYGVIRSDFTNMQIVQMDKAVPRYMFFYVNSNHTDQNELNNPLAAPYYELRYSVIDMRLNNGMGDIDPNYKDILIGKQFNAALCIIPNGKCNAWLVVSNKQDHNFYSFPILKNETIGSPIKSNSKYLEISDNSLTPNSIHLNFTLKDLIASPLGNYITSTDYLGKVEIMAFDKVSGKISSLLSMHSPNRVSSDSFDYRFRFSATEKKVFSFNHLGIICQYDASLLSDSAQFMNSKVLIDIRNINQAPFKTSGTYSNVNRNSYTYYNAFRLRNNDLYQPITLIYTDSVTNMTVSGASFIYKIKDADSLLDESKIIYVDSTNSNYNYRTSVPLSDSISGNLSQASLYNSDAAVEIFHLGRDMVIFQPNTDLDTVVTLDTVICGDVNMTLTTRYADATHIRWSTGSTDSSINIDATGRYTVTVTYPHCSFTEVFWVRSPLANISLSVNDTLMCTERPFVVYVNREGVGGRAVWQNGMIGDSMIINKGGTYHVTIKTDCGSVSDTLHVQEMSCRCSYFIPTAFTPNGDGLNDKLIVHIDCIPLEYQMHIYNRYGQLVNKLEKYGEYWDGTFIDKQPAASGVYFYRMRYKDLAGDYKTVTGDVTLLR